jgi:hypothetical protein
MSEYNYANIFNNDSEEKKSLLIQKLDKENYLETNILPKIKNGDKEKIKNIENDIYLSILLIKYKNDL